MPTSISPSESFGANAVGIYEVFGTVRPEPVAVRGERLALIDLGPALGTRTTAGVPVIASRRRRRVEVQL